MLVYGGPLGNEFHFLIKRFWCIYIRIFLQYLCKAEVGLHFCWHNPWFQPGLHHQLNHSSREHSGSELDPGWDQLLSVLRSSVLPEILHWQCPKTGQRYLGHTCWCDSVLLGIKQPDAGHKRKGVLHAVINAATDFLKCNLFGFLMVEAEPNFCCSIL